LPWGPSGKFRLEFGGKSGYNYEITMAKYAVIKISGHQFKVIEGQELLVDKIKDPKETAEVLLISDGDKVSLGKPLVSGAKVTFKILGEEKGEKIEVRTYKAKSRSRKHIGFRPIYSKIQILKITSK
jgi:large subunit ribosomal protein L21